MDEFLPNHSAEVQNLTLKARALVLSVFPDALEMIDPPSGIIAYGFSRKYSELVCALAPQRSYLNLMLAQGASLPDPHGLLKGSGKRARHVRIDRAEDLDIPAVRELLETAVARLRP